MNIENLNRVIEAIRNEPHHFVMMNWNTASEGPDETSLRVSLARNNPCNTAGCIGGWMDALGLTDIADGKMEPVTPEYEGGPVYGIFVAAAFIDLPRQSWELRQLFHMDRNFSMTRFDNLPPQKRAEAGIRAVEIFRDSGGKSDWRQALQDTGLLEFMNGGEITIDGVTYD
jgi:hypothetical protein